MTTLTITCTISHEDAGRVYFRFDTPSAHASHERLTRVAHGAKSSFDRAGFNVKAPKQPIGAIGGNVFKATVRCAHRTFKSRLEHNRGETVSYMLLTLVDLEKL